MLNETEFKFIAEASETRDSDHECSYLAVLPFSQEVPFPSNPDTQVQLNDPTVFIHRPLAWQLCMFSMHSLTGEAETLIFKGSIILAKAVSFWNCNK